MSDSELEISTRAYCKMLMHAAKYPSSSINGLLLSKVAITRPGIDNAHRILASMSVPLGLYWDLVGIDPSGLDLRTL